MTWDEVLSYDSEIRYMANKWASKIDPSLFEDAVQHTYIILYEKVDLSKANRTERNFLLGAVNNILYKFFRSPKHGRWNHISLDSLRDDGFQIDEAGIPKWPGRGEYKPNKKNDGSKNVGDNMDDWWG